jgi:tetratricopeptide (TPR) repeat protein
MNNRSEAKLAEVDIAWLKDDNPEIYHVLLALEGDLDALRWLKRHGDGLFLFVEALTGAKEAVETLQAQPPEKLVDLFDTIKHCDVDAWLSENQGELHRLFAFVRGENGEVRGHKPKKAVYKRVAEIVREKFAAYHDDVDGVVPPDSTAGVPKGAAADVGCLLGEMHLQNHDYHKAIEAFSRAIANDPTQDAYLARARAYHALAALDEHAAAELCDRPAP